MTVHEVDQIDQRNAKMRKLVLILILIALLAALAYEYIIARPSVERAYSSILAQYEQVNATASDPITNLEVHALLGKQPSRAFKDGPEQVEVFTWVSGFPLRTHNLYVVYRDIDGEQILVRHSKYAYDPGTPVYSANNAESFSEDPVQQQQDASDLPAQDSAMEDDSSSDVASPSEADSAALRALRTIDS